MLLISTVESNLIKEQPRSWRGRRTDKLTTLQSEGKMFPSPRTVCADLPRTSAALETGEKYLLGLLKILLTPPRGSWGKPISVA